MTAHPTPSEFEARTNASYEALLWALSRPGLPRSLPVAGLEAIVETLVDRECAVFTDDPALAEILQKNGAHSARVEAADHLFLAQAPDPAILAKVACGSDLYPDDGATLVFPARLGEGQQLALTGPGVDGRVEIAVAGVKPRFWADRQRAMRYPMGFEIFLVDGNQVIGLPRSTTVEVL